MLLGYRQRLSTLMITESPTLAINDFQVSQVTNAKSLGVAIDDKLNWPDYSKQKCVSEIICMENTSENWNNNHLQRNKVTVGKLRLFLPEARSVYSGKVNCDRFNQIASPVTIQVKFVWLKMAQLLLKLVRFLMSTSLLIQLEGGKGGLPITHHAEFSY